MNITPRAVEYKPVVELLESDAYDNATALAKDIVKTVYRQILERDLWIVAQRPWPDTQRDITLLYGPVQSESEGKRFIKSAALIGLVAAVPLFSPAVRLARVQEFATAESRALDGAFCAEIACQHPDYVHEHNGYGGRCAIRGCRCNKFEEGEGN